MRRLWVAAAAGFAGVLLVQAVPFGQARQASRAPTLRADQPYDEALLSKPTYKAKIEIDVKVPMRDGVTTSVDIYRPDAEGRFPAILVRSPYDNHIPRNITQSTFFAERGYVYLYEDVRGKYDSNGQFDPFKNEANDGHDMDEWIAKQPWFNGKLGTRGGSYTGFTQWGQAVRQSPHLVAMAPQYTTPDIYGNWIYVDGALNYAFALSWGAIGIDTGSPGAPRNVDMKTVYRTLPILEAPMAAGHTPTFYRDWVTNPTRDRAFWDTVSLEKHYDRIEVPILTVGGWYDIFNRGALKDDVAVRSKGKTEAARTGKRLLIGPWTHGGEAQKVGAVDFGPSATVNMDRVYLRWFDYWLKGIDNGVASEPPIKIFVMGENVWRYENEWPLKRAIPTSYYLASGGSANTLNGNGALVPEPPRAGTAPTDTFVYDPADPVPTLGGTTCCSALLTDGPFDQRPIEERRDVLVFSTPPLENAVEVTGPVALTLYASTTAKDTDWTAKLVDVAPDGFARNVQEGILRARYRETRGQRPGSLLEPNKIYEYTIDVSAASNLYQRGHRIRLEISSSNFPHFDRNLNTGEDTATGSRMEKATQTIHHSARYQSRITLPIVKRF